MNDIRFIRGDTQVFSLNIRDGDGLPYELQPTDKLVLTVKRLNLQYGYHITEGN